MKRHARIFLIFWSAYLLGVGFLLGVLVSDWRFSMKREALLQQFDRAVKEQHAHLMEIEKHACKTKEGRWAWRKC